MEKARNNSKVKIPKAKALDENISPMKIEMDDQLFTGRGRFHQSMTLSPSFQPYAENLDVSSPLVRYFRAGSPISSKVSSSGESFTSPTFGSSKYRSAIVQQYNSNSSGNTSFGSRGRFSLSPLSSIENLDIAPLMSPPVYRTPVKVDEEVLVMDDIQVRSTSGGKSGRSSSASCGGAFSSSSSSGKSMFKTDICRAWEESGNCRYFSKCQFAHGKQELRPTRLSIKDKSEAQASKSSSSTRSCTNGPRSRTGNQFQAAAGSEDAVTTSQPASPVKPEPDHTLANFNHISDWSPLDDDIELELPHYGSAKHPSREEVDAYIFSILHGPTSKRRLPAFVELCSEQDIHD